MDREAEQFLAAIDAHMEQEAKATEARRLACDYVSEVLEEMEEVSDRRYARDSWRRRSVKYPVLQGGKLPDGQDSTNIPNHFIVQCSGRDLESHQRCDKEAALKPFDLNDRGKSVPKPLMWCESCGQVAYCSHACKTSNALEHGWVCEHLHAAMGDVGRAAILRSAIKASTTDKSDTFKATSFDEHKDRSTWGEGSKSGMRMMSTADASAITMAQATAVA